MPQPTTKLIGIAGPSGSGKSAIAEALAGRLSGTAVLPMDCYYYDLSPIPVRQREECNFDSPDSLDWLLLIEHINAVSAGRAIEMPQYDFASHTRRPERKHFQPGQFVILDGLYALLDERVRELLTLAVFVDASSDVCLSRRLTRDIRDRDRTVGEVINRFSRFVLPMSRQHVLPTRQFADIVASGENPIEESVNAIVEMLENK